MSIIHELKRRNVLRIAAAYVVTAWLIIQVVETILPVFGFGDTAVRIVIVALAIGFIPAIVLAWAFEITPEGLKKDKDVDHSTSTARAAGKRLDRAIMVMLALALGYFSFDKFVLSPQRQAEVLATATQEAHQAGRSEALVESYGDKSIAVLPFVNMSSDEEQEYFSDGISEELLNLLAKIPELRVISRSSAFSFKGKDIDIPTVAEQLNVAHILEGSVRKAGNQVRITAQLIEARSDTHLWSETYDRELTDIFSIQDEIANEVVGALKIALLGDTPRAAETDPAAYAAFLQGNYLLRQHTAEGFANAVGLYRQALDIDPGYAPAWDALASTYINQAGYGLIDRDEGFGQARDAVRTALEIDPERALAHARLGWIAMVYDGDLANSAQHYQRAMELDSADLEILNGAVVLTESLGRLEEAIRLKETQVARDPVAAVGHANLSAAYYFAGRLDEAENSIRTTLALSPGYIGGQYQLGVILLFKGNLDAALAAFEQEHGDEEYRVKGLALASYGLGRQVEFEAAFTELRERWGDQWPSEVAHVYAYTGAVDEAFEWLDKDYEVSGASGWGDGRHDLLFTGLRDDPRWKKFMERVGMSDVKLADIKFEFSLPGQP